MLKKIIAYFLIFLLFINGIGCESPTKENDTVFKRLQCDSKIEVLIVGTYHFDQESNYDELDANNQRQLEKLMTRLQKFDATRVFVEKDPKYDSIYNQGYQDYLESDDFITDKENEVFQLGFRMAKRLGHDSIYLFDNKPPFVGSLENFAFASFDKYMDSVDVKFNMKHFDQINKVYRHNDSVMNTLDLYDNMKRLNSTDIANYDISRMHMLEVRFGTNTEWLGADWLGRWYQRNIRMMMHVLKKSEPNDKVLLFVGSNHKWILEQLMNNTPDFKVVNAYDFL